MDNTALVVAVVGLGLSGLVSAIKMIDWFFRSDPKELLQAGRWGALGLFVLLIPLLIGLAVNRRWLEAIGLSAVMLLAFALYVHGFWVSSRRGVASFRIGSGRLDIGSPP